MCTTPKAPDNTPCGAGLGRCLSGACDMPRFTRLPSMFPYAVSGDGSKVVGAASAIPAFMWTRATGMVALPNAVDSTFCDVSDISADGLYSVGDCSVGTAGTFIPQRWLGMNMPVNLGTPSGFTDASANAVNANGSIMIGTGQRSGSHAVLWTVGANPTVLVEPAGTLLSAGVGISASGAVAVGYVREAAGQNIDHAFRWTAAGGMQLLPFLPGGTSAQANGVSADGNMIVGGCQLPGGGRPFLYVVSSGILTNLGIPNISDTISSAQAISGDGATIMGSAIPSGPWIWNGGSLQPLATKLANSGIDVGAFTLTKVVDLSSNGKVLVGTGHATGTTNEEGWIAILP